MKRLRTPVSVPTKEGSPNWASELRKELKDRGFRRINDPRSTLPASSELRKDQRLTELLDGYRDALLSVLNTEEAEDAAITAAHSAVEKLFAEKERESLIDLYDPITDSTIPVKLTVWRESALKELAALESQLSQKESELASAREWNDKLARPLAEARAELSRLRSQVLTPEEAGKLCVLIEHTGLRTMWLKAILAKLRRSISEGEK